MFFRALKIFFLKAIVKKSKINLKAVKKISIKRVGILIDIDGQDYTSELLSELNNIDIKTQQIALLKFTNSKSKEQQSEKNILSYQDFSIFGKPKNQYAKELIKEPFDILINYYLTPVWPLICFNLKSKSILKIGFTHTQKNIFHLSINTKLKEVKTFVLEIQKYINLINQP